jgi:hypothetical protein
MTSPIMLDITKYEAEAEKLSAPLATLRVAAKQLEVVDDESNQVCLDLRNRASTIEKRIQDFWNPLCDAANKMHKMLTGKRGDHMKPWTELKNALGSKSEKYLLAQREAKRRAEAELARVAEQERLRLEQAAEELRLQGRMKEAAATFQQANATVAPVLPAAIERVEGVRVTEGWDATVTDMGALIHAIATGRVSLFHDYRGDMAPLVSVNQPVLNAVVSRLGDSINWPGVTVKPRIKIGSTGR